MEHSLSDPSARQFHLAGRLYHGGGWCARRERPSLQGGARSSRRSSRTGRGGGRERGMNRFILPLSIFALLAIVLGVAVKRSPEKGVIPSVLIGKPAPQFALPVLTDTSRTFRSEDLKGRWYVLNVWGTWCYACREEHNALLEIQKLAQVPLIGLDWKDEDPEALNYLSQLGNPYDVVAADREGRTAID